MLGLAGALASAGPARGPWFEPPAAVKITPQVSGQVADLVDTVAPRPNVPGRNVITITVADTRRPASPRSRRADSIAQLVEPKPIELVDA